MDLAWAAPRVERFIVETMQSFIPEAARYDVIWIQWCIGCLTDDDLVAFLGRCRDALAPDGLIVIKDNVIDGPCEGLVSGKYLVDHDDNSVRAARGEGPAVAVPEDTSAPAAPSGDSHNGVPGDDHLSTVRAKARRAG